MKELLYSHSIVTNPAIWILLAISVISLIYAQIVAIKSLKFESIRSKAKSFLKKLVILDFVVIGLVTAAIYSHKQLMTLDESMFSVEQNLKTVTLETKTPILVGDQLDIVKDEANVVVVRSSRGAEYRIEKSYFQKKDGN